MKNSLVYISAISLLAGCATTVPVGTLYSGGTFAQGKNGNAVVVNANNDYKPLHTGEACAKDVLSLVAWGDNSVEAAMKNGNITKVSTINYEVINVLGAWGKYCTVVKGE